MSSEAPPPRVGVAAVIVNKEGKLLIGKRKGSLGAGSWQFPGGHLEHGEEPTDCAARETLEEAGLGVQASRVVTVTNDVFADAGKHYITLFALCTMNGADAEPKASLQRGVMEADKCEMWIWWDWEKLFSGRETGKVDDIPLFLPMTNLLQQFSTVEELRNKFH